MHYTCRISPILCEKAVHAQAHSSTLPSSRGGGGGRRWCLLGGRCAFRPARVHPWCFHGDGNCTRHAQALAFVLGCAAQCATWPAHEWATHKAGLQSGVRVARVAVYGSASIAGGAGEAPNAPPGRALGSDRRLLLWLPPSAVRRATMQGLDSPALTSVAKAMAASAKSIAAVVLQLSTMPLANAARLGAGRSIASRVEAHSQAPPWLDNAVSVNDVDAAGAILCHPKSLTR